MKYEVECRRQVVVYVTSLNTMAKRSRAAAEAMKRGRASYCHMPRSSEAGVS